MQTTQTTQKMKYAKITKSLIKQLNQKFIEFASILNNSKPLLGAERVNNEIENISKILSDMYGITLNSFNTREVMACIDSLECEIRLYERSDMPDIRQRAGEFVGLCVATKFYMKALK